VAAKVFISHSSRDHNKAMALVQKLEFLDLTCWIAPRDIRPGQIWASSIMEGIASADALLVLCSEHVLESDQVLREIERAAARLELPLFDRTVGY
jgi:TIR domain